MGQRTTADEHTGYSVNLCMLIACKDQYVNPIRSSRSGLSGQVYFCHYRGKQLRCSRHYILVNRACITVFSNYHLGESWSYLRISVQGLQLCSSISESRQIITRVPVNTNTLSHDQHGDLLLFTRPRSYQSTEANAQPQLFQPFTHYGYIAFPPFFPSSPAFVYLARVYHIPSQSSIIRLEFNQA